MSKRDFKNVTFKDLKNTCVNGSILTLGQPWPKEHAQASLLEGGRYVAQSTGAWAILGQLILNKLV